MKRLVAIALAAGLCGHSCGHTAADGPRPAPSTCNLADYRSTVEQFIAARVAGLEQDPSRAMRFLEVQFQAAGLVPGGTYGSFRQCYAHGDEQRCNVIGLIPGSGSLLGEAVVVAAHFDAHPDAATGAADDNASGAAGLVALAHMLMRPVVSAPRRALILVALDGDGKNRDGLKAYLDDPIVPHARIKAALVLHRIGRLAEETIHVALRGVDASERAAWLAASDNDDVRLDIATAHRDACVADDSAGLAAAGIGTMTFTTGVHVKAGTADDASHELNWRGARRVLGVVARTVHRVLYGD